MEISLYQQKITLHNHKKMTYKGVSSLCGVLWYSHRSSLSEFEWKASSHEWVGLRMDLPRAPKHRRRCVHASRKCLYWTAHWLFEVKICLTLFLNTPTRTPTLTCDRFYCLGMKGILIYNENSCADFARSHHWFAGFSLQHCPLPVGVEMAWQFTIF